MARDPTVTEPAGLSRSDIRSRVEAVRRDIREAAQRVGRAPEMIRIVAASKLVPAERLLEAYEAKIKIFGENRLQEARQKMARIGDRPGWSWHFIGRIQRRKIKDLVGRFDLIHSIESLDQAREMNRRAGEAGIRQAVLLEVNTGGEASKGGFARDGLLEQIRWLDELPHLAIQGLMTIPPWSEHPEDSRPFFRELALLADRITHRSPVRIRMTELSMGMSQDFPVAVEEGATLVRIGTRLFGPRTDEEWTE